MKILVDIKAAGPISLLQWENNSSRVHLKASSDGMEIKKLHSRWGSHVEWPVQPWAVSALPTPAQAGSPVPPRWVFPCQGWSRLSRTWNTGCRAHSLPPQCSHLMGVKTCRVAAGQVPTAPMGAERGSVNHSPFQNYQLTDSIVNKITIAIYFHFSANE